MIVELRIYEVMPGKMGAMLDRLENVAIPILERFGIRPIGFWTTVIGPSSNAITYMLEWQSMAEREDRWTRFFADPEWIAKKAESERDGPLAANVKTQFLAPTAFSPLR